ncbi:hypothetical protein ACA910_001346 [Epithemia clementina (nom. ined.)]
MQPSKHPDNPDIVRAADATGPPPTFQYQHDEGDSVSTFRHTTRHSNSTSRNSRTQPSTTIPAVTPLPSDPLWPTPTSRGSAALNNTSSQN